MNNSPKRGMAAAIRRPRIYPRPSLRYLPRSKDETEAMASVADILNFWFEETEPEQRFKKDAAFDEMIRSRFGATHEDAMAGTLDCWHANPEPCLALLLVLDQFARNMFRGDPRSYAGDAKALAIAKRAVAAGLHEALDPERRHFMFLPFEHSENLDDQRYGLALMATLDNERAMDAARKHLVIIERFGHFPHRNQILGRDSTAAEIEFLKGPDSAL
jgi:uncharacterized protein (DUF924 family)